MFETSGSRVGVVGPVFVDAILGTGVAMETELVPEDVTPNSALIPGFRAIDLLESSCDISHQRVSAPGSTPKFKSFVMVDAPGEFQDGDFFGSSAYSVEPEQGTELYEYEPSIARDSEREQAAQVDSESEPQGVVSCD